MSDDRRLKPLGQFTAEGRLIGGYGQHYIFFAGQDDIHGILRYLVQHETVALKMNMYEYTDAELNADVLALVRAGVQVQVALDWLMSVSTHALWPETDLITANQQLGADFYDHFVTVRSVTHQISHTKGGVLLGQGIAFEGSTNWTKSGQGDGINLTGPEPSRWRAQNNTLVVTTNKRLIKRFTARLDLERQNSEPFPPPSTPPSEPPREMVLE